MSKQKKSLIHTIMGTLRRIFPEDNSAENQRAVQIFKKILGIKDFFKGKLFLKWIGAENWPITSGAYIVSDRSAVIAVCTLTSPELMEPMSHINGVAITGRLVTVNLGIEKIILNTISNPNIRFLLVCGKESPVFHPAQALRCLFQFGTDSGKRIREAQGHFPVLNNLDVGQIEQFRSQIEMVDCTGIEDLEILNKKIESVNPGEKEPFNQSKKFNATQAKSSGNNFKQIRPGGQRGAPVYDPNGFFIISVNHEDKEIILRHYLPDNTPVHEVKAKRAEAIMRAIVHEELVSQLSHAGYLGIELAKAETALRLGLNYEQDHPLRSS